MSPEHGIPSHWDFPYHHIYVSALPEDGTTLTRPIHFLEVPFDIGELSRNVDNLSYPGLPRFDAIAQSDNSEFWFRCNPDSEEGEFPSAFPILRQRKTRGHTSSSVQRENTVEDMDSPLETWHDAFDAAVLAARGNFTLNLGFHPPANQSPLEREEQVCLLKLILSGQKPWKGFDILGKTGFIDTHWPDLANLSRVGHSKEHHPEGNVWEHTLATFRYRKTPDMIVSLALLLHDVGKPPSQTNDIERPFDGHAELGADIAARFLRSLDFPAAMVEEVRFLVGNHMIPGALELLPISRTERIMSHPSFPRLLEVFRCDLSSTFTGPEAYYAACREYRDFLRHRKNPWRGSDGKKLMRLYVEDTK